MKLKVVVGINLKYYRYQTGLSQEKFYTRLGLNHKYLASVERGKANISIDYVEDLAHRIGVSTEDLVTFKEEHVIKKKRVDEKIKVVN